MNTQIRITNQKKKLVNNIKAEEKEAWLKIVVKIIRWKDGVTNAEAGRPLDKITPKEWQQYCKGILKNNIVNGKEKAQQNLKSTEETIKRFHGFADI